MSNHKLISIREAPPERSIVKADIVTPVINDAQQRILTGKTPDYAIKTRPGRGGIAFRYVQYGYVVDQLNKAFGWDWDFHLLPVFDGNLFRLTETTEKFQGKDRLMRNIAVYGELTVRVHRPKSPCNIIATITKPGPGSQNWEATIEFGDALKGAKSDALKVAAHELGIGIDLYWNDQAELEEWEETQRNAGLIQPDIPQNAAQLIIRTMDELQLTLERMYEIIEVDVNDITIATPEQIAKWWAKLQMENKA